VALLPLLLTAALASLRVGTGDEPARGVVSADPRTFAEADAARARLARGPR